MKYVLDASVALKWVLDEPNVERALELRNEFENSKTELIAPDSVPTFTGICVLTFVYDASQGVLMGQVAESFA